MEQPQVSGKQPTSPVENSRFRVGFATDIGRRRSQNQDNLAVAPELGLFIVADGMGGHQGGETASAIATEVIPLVVRETQQQSPNWDARALVAQAIRTANDAIFKRSLETPNLRGMGTTTTALLFKNMELYVGHVGDSRCYLFRKGTGGKGASDIHCWQVTRDHSLVQEKLRAGLITRDEIKTDRMKNVITRSVGFEREINVETYRVLVRPGDLYLICSDGLSGLVTEAKLLEIVRSQMKPEEQFPSDAARLESAVRRLIQSANDNGGDDNITSIVIEVL